MKYLMLGILMALSFVFAISHLSMAAPEWLNQAILSWIQQSDLSAYLYELKLLSATLLIAFLSAEAEYSVLLNGMTSFKKIQLEAAGILFILLVGDMLFAYYTTLYAFKLTDELVDFRPPSKSIVHSAAMQIYLKTGKHVLYHEFDNSIKRYEPSQDVIELKETFDFSLKKMHMVPAYLIIALLLIHYSEVLARWMGHKRLRAVLRGKFA